MLQHRMWRTFILCAVVQLTSGQLTQTDLDRVAKDMHLKVKVLENTADGAYEHKIRFTLTNRGSVDVPNTGWKLYFHSFFLLYPDIIPKVAKHVDLELEKVRISMVQGDLFTMEPIVGFKALQPNSTREIELTKLYWSVSRTDFMPHFYITTNSNNVELRILTSTMDLSFVEAFSDVRQWKRYNFDRFNPFTAQQRFTRLHIQDTGKVENLVIPTPKMVIVGNEADGTIMVDNTWLIHNESSDTVSSAAYLANVLNIGYTSNANASKVIKLMIDPTTGSVPEAYTLSIMPSQNMILLTGRDMRGLFYAIQSLLSIAAGYNNENIPAISITDEPRYPYRGMHIDVARNFHSVDDIKRVLDAMAMYKLNTLHMHLTDDEGWRLEIPGIPELTEVGGKRCHDLTEQMCIIPQLGSGPYSTSRGSGYYTVNDYKDILRYANERHIEVIPEFDMPGHAHAAIASMEKRYNHYSSLGDNVTANQYRLIDPKDTSDYLSVQNWYDNAVNPCVESTFAFIEKVLDELVNMHAEIQPLKAYHHGGDEVASGAWENSTACHEFLMTNPTYDEPSGIKRYFVERMARLTNEKGLSMGGWDGGFMNAQGSAFDLDTTGNRNMFANAWDNVWEWGGSQRAHLLANGDYKVVMSQATHLFFDHPYEPDPEERGLYWAPRFTDTYRVFAFKPDDLYANIDNRRSGEPLTKADVCGQNMENCATLQKPENIIGMQAHLWGETIRSTENIDYMIFPRLLALSERAWHKADFEMSEDESSRHELLKQEWQAFANTVGHKELARLDSMGYKYRIPPPGARVMDNMIEVSTTFPGLKVEISYDQGTSWMEIMMDNPPSFPSNSTVHLRTKSKDGMRSSRVIQLFRDEPIAWSDQPTIDYIADKVEVKVDVVDNLNKTDNFITMKLHLNNTGSHDVHAGTWRIYLYSLYGLKMEVLDCGLRTGHVNGGLYYVTPNSNMFSGIMAGQILHCTFHNKWWSVARTDQFPNWYTSSLGMMPKVIRNTADETLSFVGDFDSESKWKRIPEDKYDPYTPLLRFYNFSRANDDLPFVMVLPTPYSVTDEYEDPSDMIEITEGSSWKVHHSSEFKFESEHLAKKLGLALESMLPSSGYIRFVKGVTEYNMTESYHINVNPVIPAITITTNDKPGAFYAVQTLIALVINYEGYIPNMTIKDKPRFSYRGLMIDSSRNFKTKDTILKTLDAMAMYKLNKLHFHLTDDEGWRVEIPEIPELTQIGAYRCHTDEQDSCLIPQLGSGPHKTSPGSGYYTVEDYQEILAYAAERHIEIIPEVDMPGHSTAAIHAMDQRGMMIKKKMMHGTGDVDQSFDLKDLDENIDIESPQRWRLNAINPCINSTYDFVRALIRGVKMMHEPFAKLKAFHIGGDEVPEGIWNTSEACKATYPNVTTKFLQREFVKRVADIVAEFDLDLAIWEDGVYSNNAPNPISDFKSDHVYVYPWNNRWELGFAKRTAEFANEGYKVILPLATHLYFDHPQEPDPEERGLYWASRVTDIKKVFDFIPENIFANADVTRMGDAVSLPEICNNQPCPMPTKPENVIGIQAVMFSETMRTEEQFHHMGFPRILALAERAWHKASWEDRADLEGRIADRDENFEAFVQLLGEKELPRLEDNHILYRVPPPGARVEGAKLEVVTRFPNHPVEYSTDGGDTWKEICGDSVNLPIGNHTIQISSRSPVLRRYSRVVEINANIKSTDISAATTTTTTTKFSIIFVLFDAFIIKALI